MRWFWNEKITDPLTFPDGSAFDCEFGTWVYYADWAKGIPLYYEFNFQSPNLDPSMDIKDIWTSTPWYHWY